MSKEAVGKNHYWAEILQAGYEITEDLYGGGPAVGQIFKCDFESVLVLLRLWF